MKVDPIVGVVCLTGFREARSGSAVPCSQGSRWLWAFFSFNDDFRFWGTSTQYKSTKCCLI